MSKSGPPALWTLAAVEGAWLSSLRGSRDWLHDQLKGGGPDRFGNPWNPDYWTEIQQQPERFKRWIKKASSHSRQQHALLTYWQEWHHDFLTQLIQSGYRIPFPWPKGSDIGDKGDACLRCHRTFANKAAWSVHAFKKHRRVNDKRPLIYGTRCEACMKEFTSQDRLQRHLNYKTSCAVRLRHEGLLVDIQPGINSKSQRRPEAFPKPVMRTAGPQRNWEPLEHQEWTDGILDDFEEELFDCIQGWGPRIDFLKAVEHLKAVFEGSEYAFSDLRKTFDHFKNDVLRIWEEHREDAEHITTDFLRDIVTWVDKRLNIRWFFTEDECTTLPGNDELRAAAWDHSCGRRAEDDHAVWYCEIPVPKFGFHQLVVLHLFAGEKRDGDLQDALHGMVAPSGYSVVILAVDIIFDSVRADLSVKSNQERWLNYIRRGFVLAIFAGPPCESWSRSRQSGGIPELTSGDGGPRTIRSAARPLGLTSLRPREVLQLRLANCLLMFTLSAFLEMTLLGRFAMIEHPACPSDEGERWIASIWRLYVVQVLQNHPWVQCVNIMQGHYGAKSPKPTTLLFAIGRDIDVSRELLERRTSQTLPKALKMGRTGKGEEFATASLKNYPSGLCRALAGILNKWILTFVRGHESTPNDRHDFGLFLDFVQNLEIHFNFVAQRGADFAQ